MEDIRGVLGAAGRRLLTTSFLWTLCVALSVGVGGVLVARIVERVFGLALPWDQIFLWTPIAAVIAAAAWALVLRPNEHAVARVVDERADLRESLSTALIIEREQDGWSRAVVESARERARAVDLKRALPIETPRLWPVPVALAALVAAVWYAFPELDVLGRLDQQRAEQKQQAEIREVRAQINEQEKKLEELLNKAGMESEQAAATDMEAEEPVRAGDLQSRQVARLTKVSEALKEAQQGEKALELDAVKRELRQLRQPGQGPMDQLSRSIARGDFKDAQKQLDELAKKVASGDLTPEQKKLLESQLKNMSKQLGERADNRDRLEQKLKAAGMNEQQAKQAAADPEAMKKALEQLKNMTEEQKKELMKQAAAEMKACGQCSGMGEAMSKMAQSMQQGASGLDAEGMQQLGQQLSELEQMAGEMAGVDESLAEAMRQLSELGECMGGGKMAGMLGGSGMGQSQLGEWSPGDSTQKGQGSGGAGKGFGAGPEGQEAPFKLANRKSPTKSTGDGPVIGSRFVYEMQVRGTSTAEYADAVESSSQAAAEAIQTSRVLTEHEDLVKHFFGELQKKVENEKGEGSGDDADDE